MIKMTQFSDNDIEKYVDYANSNTYVKRNPLDKKRFIECVNTLMGNDNKRKFIFYTKEAQYRKYLENITFFNRSIDILDNIMEEFFYENYFDSSEFQVNKKMLHNEAFKDIFYLRPDSPHVSLTAIASDFCCWLKDNLKISLVIPDILRKYRYVHNHTLSYCMYTEDSCEIFVFWIGYVEKAKTIFEPEDAPTAPTCFHSTTEPAVVTNHGEKFCFFRHMSYPTNWLNKRVLTPQTVMSLPNVEQRRIAMEILGWEKLIKDKGVVIDEDDDTTIGTLYALYYPELGTSIILKVKCGTGRTFYLPVPNDMESAKEANAWTYGFDYKNVKNFIAPEVRT